MTPQALAEPVYPAADIAVSIEQILESTFTLNNEALPEDCAEVLRQAARLIAGLGSPVCHRLHTPGGRWAWVDGEPSLQACDDARNFGWTMELAFALPPLNERAAAGEPTEQRNARISSPLFAPQEGV